MGFTFFVARSPFLGFTFISAGLTAPNNWVSRTQWLVSSQIINGLHFRSGWSYRTFGLDFTFILAGLTAPILWVSSLTWLILPHFSFGLHAYIDSHF
jgi:hypothetical protein